MPKTTFAGHPLHPQLVGLPIGLLPFSFVMDTAYAVTREKTYAKLPITRWSVQPPVP
jgi:uncharacterized membrane protein